MTSDELQVVHKCNLHSVAIALLVLISRVTGINSLLEYAQKIVDARKEEAAYILPPLLDQKKIQSSNMNISLPHLSIDKMALAESLQGAGLDCNRLLTGLPYSLHQMDNSGHRHSWVESAHHMPAQRNSSADLTSYNADADSTNSSPVICKKALAPEFNFDAMKRAIAEPSEAVKREQRDKQIKIVRIFRESNFDELIRRTDPKHDVIQNRLNDLFSSLTIERQISQCEIKSQENPIYAENFPEMFFF